MNTLNTLISLFPNAMDVDPDRLTTLHEYITDIAAGQWENQVSLLRTHLARGDRKRYDASKRELPGVTMSAACVSRAHDLSPEAKALTHSGWLQADFDLKDNPLLSDEEYRTEMRARLLADPHIGAVFVGPSGEGLKAAVSIDTERHRESWFAAEAYIASKFDLKLDKSTKDPLRLCFVSYDPLAATSEDFTPLPVPELEARTTPDVWRPPVETTAADIEEMLKFVPPRPDYETWLRIASAVWSVLPMGDGCRLLAQWSPEERDGEYADKHKHRLEQVGIGTLVHVASAHGFDARAAWKRKRWCGRIRFADGVRSPSESEDPSADPAPMDIIAEVNVPRERIAAALEEGQVGDARLWCEMRRGLRTWNIHASLWMIYEEGVWKRDEGQTTILDISDTLCRIYGELIASIRAEMAANPAPDKKKDHREKEVAKIEAKRAMLRSRTYLRNVEQLSAAEMQVCATDFDASPDLLAVENGTLDFSEGLFREHRPSDYLTHRTPIRFDPDARCPAWDGFLEYFMGGNQEMIRYLARAVGYSITGRVHEDALFFCYGKGANGKSTFLGGLKLLLGDLMTTVPISALLAEKSDSNYDYHKASMQGRRAVMTDEIPEGKRLAENQIKALVGGDPIAARRPFEKPYEFMPTHKLWLVGNHKLEIRGTDHGIWRRIHLVPWVITITEERKRPRHEVFAEFAAERSGILNWAILGILESQQLNGLKPPSSVVEATKEYRNESDQFGQFIEECLIEDPTSSVKIKTVLAAYKRWCEDNGEPARYGSSKKISNYFREAGFVTKADGHDKTSSVFGFKFVEVEKDEEPAGVLKFSR
jgi:putative DNA primase/helicase